PATMERLAQSAYGFSPSQVRALAEEWADAVVGMGLVLLAFALGFSTLAFLPDSGKVLHSHAEAAAWGAGIVAVVGFLVKFLRRQLYQGRRRAMGTIVTA